MMESIQNSRIPFLIWLCVFSIFINRLFRIYIGSLKQLMIIAYYSCNFPFAVFLLPYMDELKSAAILFSIFKVTKSMYPDLHCTIARYRVNFKTSIYEVSS